MFYHLYHHKFLTFQLVLSCISLSLLCGVQRQQKIQRDRLMNDFSAALNNFQAVQRRAAEREKESVARARAGSRLSVSRSQGWFHTPVWHIKKLPNCVIEIVVMKHQIKVSHVW